MTLGDHVEGGARLDHVASVLILNDNAALRGVGRASSTMNEEARAATHVVRGCRVQVIAVVHALKGSHVAKSVRPAGQRPHTDLALASSIVTAGARMTTAAAGGADHGAIISSAREMVSTLRVRVRTTRSDIVLVKEEFLLSLGSTHRSVLRVVEIFIRKDKSNKSNKQQDKESHD